MTAPTRREAGEGATPGAQHRVRADEIVQSGLDVAGWSHWAPNGTHDAENCARCILTNAIAPKVAAALTEAGGRPSPTADVIAWAQATFTALNVGDVQSESLLHKKLREVLIAYRASDFPPPPAGSWAEATRHWYVTVKDDGFAEVYERVGENARLVVATRHAHDARLIVAAVNAVAPQGETER